MKIGILGTGGVARSIGGKLMDIGLDVVFGTRNVAETTGRTAMDGMGNVPFAEWMKSVPNVRLVTFAEAALHGEVLVNATSGNGSLSALRLAGSENTAGKILIDISNPLDFSKGFPPFLSVCNTDSLGEQIQRAFPDAKVVKTLNTMNAFIMVNPGLVPGDHSVFMSGNDGGAKETVVRFLEEWFGWKRQNIVDVGDITTARGTEMLLPIWVRLYGALNSPMFNFHIVREKQVSNPQ